MDYPWPGNVRELKSTVERAVLISDGDEIDEGDLLLGGPQAIRPWAERLGEAPASPEPPAPAPAAPEPAAPVQAAPLPADSAPAPLAAPPASGPPAPAPSGDGAADPAAFPPLARPSDAPQPRADDGRTAALADSDAIVPLEDLKRRAVERAFAICEGNAERAAGELGIGRATMYRLLKKYDISTE